MASYHRALTILKTRRREVTTTNKNSQNNIQKEMTKELEVDLFIAVLVATVTFAAGFTLPGGLVTNKPTYKAFLVFNSIAFCSSIFVVGFHFINSTVHNDFSRISYKAAVKPFTGFSILAMTLGFCFGTFAMSTTLAKVPFILLACFMSILFLHIRQSPFVIKILKILQHPIYTRPTRG